MQIDRGAFAVVAYRLSDEHGHELETSEQAEPITYVHGYGMLVPGLEAGLYGLRAGDSKTIVVGVDDGFGARDEDLVFAIAREELPSTDSIEPGDFIVAEDEDGDSADLRVVSVHEDHVVVDGNHELAGKVLQFAVVVQSVRAATAEELSAAQEAFGASAPTHAETAEVQQEVRDALRGMVDKHKLN